MASFSFFVCSLLESLCFREVQAGRQEEPARSPRGGCSRLAGERDAILQAGSSAGRQSLLAAGAQCPESPLRAGDRDVAEESRQQTAWS